MKRFVGVSLFVVSLVALAYGCSSPAFTCGEGEELVLEDGAVCVYDEDIVIETGFTCPEERPYLHGGEGRVVCSSDQGLTPDEISDINEQLGEDERFRDPTGGSTGTDASERGWDVDKGVQVADVLFVIDNSGSMCEEQRSLAKEFNSFLGELDLESSDVQIGVTTTHKAPEGLPEAEFVAEYGVLQTQPNPLPSSFGSCGTASSVETALERAVGCTEDPSQFRARLEQGERDCLDDGGSTACQEYCEQNIDESWCEQTENGSYRFRVSRFTRGVFPPGDAYRDLEGVMRTSDYRAADGSIQRGAMVNDFSCLSFVGTTGWSFEKGLGAAVEAVSPEKAEGPNAGFIRKDAGFGVIFLTDENDCTHDGSIDELDAAQCGDDVCEFENSTRRDPDDSALVSIDDLKSELMNNLREVKGREAFSEDEVFVAGIYGAPDRYTGATFTREECAADSYTPVQSTCSSGEFGTAYSGDRYERFLSLFDARYPPADDPVKGKICEAQFELTIGDIGQEMAAWLSGGSGE
jgi:hypothetical protein